MTSPELLRDKLASLKWHLTEGTVNREIIFGLFDECQALTRTTSTVSVGGDARAQWALWVGARRLGSAMPRRSAAPPRKGRPARRGGLLRIHGSPRLGHK